MLLTIAIPTYNRCDDLRHCLDSLRNAWKPEFQGRVELVISSNASNDGTREYIGGFDVPGLPLRFHEWPENVGAIRNFYRLVELSEAEYCWLLSDDDAIEANSISLILDHLGTAPGGILLKTTAWDPDMREIVFREPAPAETCRVLRSPVDGESTRELLHDWGLLSVCVFQKRLWNRFFPTIPNEQAGVYPHVWILALALHHSSHWIVLQEPTVRYRSDRDLFMARSGLHRGLMAIESYGFLAKHFAPINTVTATQGLRLCCQFARHYSKKLKSGWAAADSPQSMAGLRLLYSCFRLGGWKSRQFYTQAVPACLTPGFLMRFLMNAKKSLRPKSYETP